jgi:uncharacterized membrane protein
MRPHDELRASRKPLAFTCQSAVVRIAIAMFALIAGYAAGAAEVSGGKAFRDEIRPMLQEFCFDCHADGANKGGVSFDEFKSDAAVTDNHDLWLKALKNVRAGIMPPPKKAQPNAEQKRQLEQWIKAASRCGGSIASSIAIPSVI